MEMKNYFKKSILIHDGLENDFLYKDKEVNCPFCSGVVKFRLYNSRDFDHLQSIDKGRISKKIKGMKQLENNLGRYMYKNQSIRYSKCQCTERRHELLIFFTYAEVQPGRYVSYLIGIIPTYEYNENP